MTPAPSQPDTLVDWRLILDRDGVMDLQSRVRADLPAWQKRYFAQINDPGTVALVVALLDCLPDSIGDEQARLLVAHDALCGRRGDMVRACLAELAAELRGTTSTSSVSFPDDTPLAIRRAHEHAVQHRIKQRRRANRRSA